MPKEYKPLLDDSEIIMYNKGRFPLQLDIPSSSTLTKEEIITILEISSWGEKPIYPCQIKNSSVLIPRRNSITKSGVELEALEITGIGYTNNQGPRAEFIPPDKSNSLEETSEKEGAIMVAKRDRFDYKKPSYGPKGTYTPKELKKIIDKTTLADTLKLTELVVPHIEAYGRYSDLDNKKGYSGFIVIPHPSIDSKDANKDAQKWIRKNYSPMYPKLTKLMKGLRELHEKGYAHLDPWLYNAHFVDGKFYLKKWENIVKLNDILVANWRNRAMDVMWPTDNCIILFMETFFPIPNVMCSDRFQLAKQDLMKKVISFSLEDYLGNGKVNLGGLFIIDNDEKKIRALAEIIGPDISAELMKTKFHI